MAINGDFPFNYPNPERAEFLAHQALEQAEADPSAAVKTIEEAIALDSIGALNTYHVMRAQWCKKLGQDSVLEAIELYGQAIHLAQTGRHRDARLAYLDAAALDPKLVWPLNNLAWMLSTSTRPEIRAGAAAVEHALEACRRSNWNCYAFIETLAAAYAEAGDFDRALGWQQASLQLAPEHHKPNGRLLLRHFQIRQPYIDEGMPAAAGADDDAHPPHPAELLRRQTISLPALKAVFDSAYLQTEIDDRGNLSVHDRIRVLVQLSDDRDQIVLIALSGAREDAAMDARLNLANRINLVLGPLRAAVHPDGYLIFDHSLPIRNGLTKTALVAALKSFVMTLSAAARHCDVENVLASGEEENA